MSLHEFFAMVIGKSLRFLWLKHEDVIAFATGDLVAVVFALQIDIFHSVLRITGVFFFAVIGGIGGIVGKWIILWVERVAKKWYRYFTRKRGI